MKSLIDTCVWSLSLRRRNKAALTSEEQRLTTALASAIQDGRAAIIGAIRQEVLSGIRDKGQFSRIESLLEPFSDEELTTADYVTAARLYNRCRDHGVECGPIDMLICAVAVRRRYQILTCDRALLRCMKVLRAENLLPE